MRRRCIASLVTVCLLGVSSVANAGKGEKGAGDKPRKTPDEIFTKLDTNNDQSLSLEEFKAWQHRRPGQSGKAPADKPKGDPEARAAKRFEKMDTNHDQKVSLDEFKAGLEAFRAAHKAKENK